MDLNGLIHDRLTALLFPSICLGCELPLIGGERSAWCECCRRKLMSDLSACCPKCGAEFRHSDFLDGCCRLCRAANLEFDSAVALGNYRDVLQKLIIEMKGRRDETLAYQLGLLLGERIRLLHWATQIDGLVPIPIHWSKRLQKGFHAAAIIADGVIDATSIPRLKRLLQCTRRTQKQGTLDTLQRIQNVKGSIATVSRKHKPAGAILLVDDVMTSGATANEASGALIAAGADTVRVAVVARGARVGS